MEQAGHLFYAMEGGGGGTGNGSDGTKKIVQNKGGTGDALADCFSNIDGLKYIGENTWQSKGGLIYGYDPKHGTRVSHVLAHLVADFSKRLHTIFACSRNQVFKLIDEAWTLRLNVKPIIQGGGKTLYIIPMNRVVGAAGETCIKIVVKEGVKLITAFPSK